MTSQNPPRMEFRKTPRRLGPVVGDRRVQIAGDDVGDLVFEALLLVVGEGQVVRIGADPEVRRRPTLRTGHEGHAGGGDEQRPREFTPCGMHACSVRVRQKVNAVPKYYTRCRSAFAPAPGALLHLPTAIGVTLRLLTTRTRAACRPRC